MNTVYRSPALIENSNYLFDVEQYKQAVELQDYITQLSSNGYASVPDSYPTILHDVPLEQCQKDFRSLAEEIEEVTAPFHTKFGKAHSLNEVEGIKPLDSHLTYLASRFIVQSSRVLSDEDSETYQNRYSSRKVKSSTERANDLVGDLPWIVRKLERFDLPVYTALFEAYDNLHAQSEEGIVEAYMGRDGIFAYYARLGQLAARGNLQPQSTPEGMTRTQARYVVMSRQIKDFRDKELLSQYVKQSFEGLSKDVHAYDTGFTGTIPEKLLNILEIPQSEFNQRIHLMEERGFHVYSRQILPEVITDAGDSVEMYAQMHGESRDLVRKNGLVMFRADSYKPSLQFTHLLRRHLLYSYFLKQERQKISQEHTGIVPASSTDEARELILV